MKSISGWQWFAIIIVIIIAGNITFNLLYGGKILDAAEAAKAARKAEQDKFFEEARNSYGK